MGRIISLDVLAEKPLPNLAQLGLMASPNIFSQEAIDRAIARAGTKLDEGKSGVVVHYDTQGELSASVVYRLGNHLDIKAGAFFDTSKGFHFDKEHLAASGELVFTF